MNDKRVSDMTAEELLRAKAEAFDHLANFYINEWDKQVDGYVEVRFVYPDGKPLLEAVLEDIESFHPEEIDVSY